MSQEPTDLCCLLIRAISDDRGAWDWIVDRYSEDLRRWFGRHYPHYGADDLTQKLFRRLLQHNGLRRFVDGAVPEKTTESIFWRWLRSEARGVVSNEIKKQQNYREHFPAALPSDDVMESVSPDPEQELLRRDAMRRLAACLRIEDTRLLVLQQYRQDGYSVKEAAAVLGWPESTAYKLNVKRKAALKRCLGW